MLFKFAFFTVNQTRKLEMLLKNENAIIYGAGGSIGGAVERAFAREGATVCLVGRTLDTLDKVAKELS
jgi:short-subunit dehydrogenase